MQIMNSRHERFGCSFIDMDFKMEVRKGYSSTFHFECKMCGTTSCISTENKNENPYLPINQAIINGSIAIGMYFLIVLYINRFSKISAIILIVIVYYLT